MMSEDGEAKAVRQRMRPIEINSDGMDAARDPFARFDAWFALADADEPNDPNAMTLATLSDDGPTARIVLLKSVDDAARGADRGFVFFTNAESRKGRDIARDPRVCLLFHWKTVRLQIRIEGAAALVSDAESDAYFASRGLVSRIGAAASDQSRPLPDRATLLARVAAVQAAHGSDGPPRPRHWAGYRVTPQLIEFWREVEHRLHDRLVYRRDGDGWATERLYP